MKHEVEETKLRAIFASSPDAITVSDLNGNITDCNRAALDMGGFSSKEEVIGKSGLEFIAKKDHKRAMENMKKTLEQDSVKNIEYTFLTKDGREYPAELSASVIKDSSGNLTGFVAITKDITERKQIEEERKKLLHDYGERIKELRCLYRMSKLLEKPGVSLDEILQGTANLLPPAWQYPDISCARVVFEGREFKTKNFKETRWKQQADIKVHGKKVGTVEVYYVEEKPIIDEGPFLKEERDLIYAVADRLRKTIEHKMIEKELQKSEKQLRYLVNSMDDMIFVIGLDGTFKNFYQPPRVGDLYIPPEEFIGKHFRDVLPPDVVGLLQAAIKKIETSGEIQEFDYSLEMKGKKSWYNAKCSPMKDQSGHTTSVTVVVRNITRRKKAEKALQESEEKFKTVAEQSPNMIFVNKKGRVVYANRKCEEIMGYKREEFYSPDFDFLNLIDSEFKDLVKASFFRHMKGEDVAPYEYALVTKEGKRIEIMNATKLIRYDGDTAILGILTDITELKQMEKKLEEYSQHLEELVEKRTRQLKEAQEQLLKAERLAAIGEVATMVGHDLRNPLQSIENATYYLNNELSRLPPSTPIPQKAPEMLQIINKSVNYADKIIKDLHDFSATKKPTIKKTNINTIVKGTLSQLETPENVELITELGHLPKIKADKDMIKRIFINLALNGTQAMNEKGGTLKVSTKKTKGFVEISFKDTGIGIPKENLGKIFTPFFTTKAQGMGMGLPICKKFVEIHGGSIEVESQEGKGTTFTVKLPIQQENGGENQ